MTLAFVSRLDHSFFTCSISYRRPQALLRLGEAYCHSPLLACAPTAGVGQERGFFGDEGFDVELIRMNANISVTALSTGNIDYTMIFGSVVRGATYDSPWRDFSEDGAIPETGLKLVIDQGREAMKIDRSVANAEVADFALLREVHKELGKQ